MHFTFQFVVGLVGPKAAGKTTAAKYLANRYRFYPYPLSTPLQLEAKRRGFDPAPVQVLQDIGDEWRHQQGPGILVSKTLDLAKKHHHSQIVIDGIRNPGEITILTTQIPSDKLLIIGITSPLWSRYRRFKRRARAGDRTAYREFLATNRRDLGIGQPPEGQQVAQCLELIPRKNLIINNQSISTFTSKLDKLIETYSNL